MPVPVNIGECPGHHITSVTPASPPKVNPGSLLGTVGMTHLIPSVPAHPPLPTGGTPVDKPGHGKTAITGTTVTPVGHASSVPLPGSGIPVPVRTPLVPPATSMGIGSPKGNP